MLDRGIRRIIVAKFAATALANLVERCEAVLAPWGSRSLGTTNIAAMHQADS